MILDSSVVIAAERRGDNVTQMLKQIVLSSVGLTELAHGIYRAQSVEARNRRDSFIRELLNDVEVSPYTLGYGRPSASFTSVNRAWLIGVGTPSSAPRRAM